MNFLYSIHCFTLYLKSLLFLFFEYYSGTHLSFPLPIEYIRASSVARTPSATISSATCLVLGGSSPSLIPATGFAFARGLVNPPRLYTLHPALYTIHQSTFPSQNDANIALFHIKTCIYQQKAVPLQRKLHLFTS